VLVATLAGLQLLDREWTQPAADPIDVVLLQGNIAQDKKWDPRYRDITLERYQALTAQHLGADIVIWPEAAIPMWHDQAKAYLAELEALADQAGTSLMIGVPVREAEGRTYNAVVSLSIPQASTTNATWCPSVNMFRFGIFGVGPRRARGAHVRLHTGTGSARPECSRVPVGALICYEAVFGAEVTELLPEAQLLVNVSNDAWFGSSLGPPAFPDGTHACHRNRT
jgi:apolipoprotein N-acyltransferase